MSKDETRKKKSITQKDLRKIRVKKTFIRGLQIFNWKVKLNWKITLIKEKSKSKEWGSNCKKKKQQKIWLNNEIKSQKNFNKSAKEKTLENEDQNEKHMRNSNWRTKLKIKLL
jgi:hypothetical protein